MAVVVGVFSIMTVLLSAAELIKNDSEKNDFLLFAIFNASSIFEAYCKISRAISDTGVADPVGISDFAAFNVIDKPCIFMPETTPVKPPQVMIINLCPLSGFTNSTIL